MTGEGKNLEGIYNFFLFAKIVPEMQKDGFFLTWGAHEEVNISNLTGVM